MKPPSGLLFAWETPPQSTLGRWSKRLFAALFFGGMFLLPFFGWLAAEPTPYSDPAGHFTITPPDGWSTDDSGHLGPGLVAKGAANPDGVVPLIHLTHEAAGIVNLEVRWQTLLGQMRYDNERMRFLAIEEHPDANPPYAQTIYLFRRGTQEYQALTRLVRAGGRFYELTAATSADDFDLLHPTLVTAFDSLRIGKK